MNRIHLASALVLSAALAGCSGTQRARSGGASGGQIVSVNEKGEKIVCQMERPTGSNIAEMVCHKQADLDLERQQTQNAMKKIPQANMRPTN